MKNSILMDNLAKAFCTMMEIMKLTTKEDFYSGTVFLVSYHKITLIEKKYDTELITLISMYHLKLLVSLDRFIKN